MHYYRKGAVKRTGVRNQHRCVTLRRKGNLVYYTNKNTLQLCAIEDFCRSSSLQAVWDTAIARIRAVLIGDVNFLNILYCFQDFHEKRSALLSSAGLFVFFPGILGMAIF